MEELRLVVSELNKPPFSKGLSLVALDEKSPIELLQLVIDVLSEMDAKMRRDIRHEPKDAIVYSIVDFVAMLNYKPAIDNRGEFQSNLAADNRQVTHALLHWLLRPQSMVEFKTRAYLARFLRRLEIPQQFMTNDPSDPLRSLSQELRTLQEKFVSVHRNVTKLRNQDAHANNQAMSVPTSAAALTKAIEQMDSEKSQLELNISRIQGKINTEAQFQNVDFRAILQITSQLRKMQEEQGQLQQSFVDQSQLLKHAQEKYNSMHRRWRAVRDRETAGKNIGPMEIVNRLRSEVQGINAQRNKCILEIADLQKSLESQLALTSEKFTEEQVAATAAEIAEIQSEVQTLTALKENIYQKTDDQLRVFRNQAGAMENKRKAIISEVNEMEADLTELKRELADLDAALGFHGNWPRSQADIKRYMNELQTKTQTYKTLKHNLQETRKELAVLVRTEEVLRSRDENLTDLIQNMEQEKGITGYEKTQGRIEEVSMAKSGIDVDKGATLEAMSQVVNQVLTEIKSKKHELAPIIQELKEQREVFQEIEKRYIEKKRIWDSVAIGYENERSKLEYELDENSNGFSREESQFHLINSLMTIEDGNIARLQREKQLLKDSTPNALMGKYASYRNMLESVIRGKEQLSRSLRKEQKEIQMDHNNKVNQRQSFVMLRQLIQAKIQMFQIAPEDQSEHNFLKISQGDQLSDSL